ncbi:kinetochore complex Sim4 subunit Fta1-domain-containing protein [Xylariaceae sp. FL0594]|nr:kinetochore complex Sim4 subunit Fta1-domain-containing protein [Xylariaceae sp. FL0594]
MLPRLDGDDGNENAPSWTRTRSTTTITISPTSEDHEKAEKDKFIHFPLLLVRMPAPLRAVLVDFLSSTFDCRISPLHLGTRTLVRSWEEWIRYNSDSDSDSVSGNNNNNNNVLLRKDLGLTLGFSIETPPSSSSVMKKNTDDIKADTTTTPLGLKTIDVVVPAEEVRRFLRIGTNTNTNTSISKKRARDDSHTPTHHHHPSRRRKLAGEEGWTWRNSHSQSQQHPSSPENANDPTTEKEIETESFPQPFTEALSLYLAHHLALDLFHPSVRVLRVVCDAFALSDGGRVKVFAPDMHTDKERREGSRTAGIEAFVRNLIHTAQGPGWSKSALRLAGLLGAAGT